MFLFVLFFVFILWVCLLLFEGGGCCCFVLFILGFVSLIVVFFVCCCHWLLIALAFSFLFFLYRGGGHSWYVQLCDRLCIYYVFIYDFSPPFLLMLILLYPHYACRDWYECASECTWHHDMCCCNIRLPVKTGLDVRVSVHHDTLHEL